MEMQAQLWREARKDDPYQTIVGKQLEATWH